MMMEILNIHTGVISFKADIGLFKIFKLSISCHNIAKLAADAWLWLLGKDLLAYWKKKDFKQQ